MTMIFTLQHGYHRCIKSIGWVLQPTYEKCFGFLYLVAYIVMPNGNKKIYIEIMHYTSNDLYPSRIELLSTIVYILHCLLIFSYHR